MSNCGTVLSLDNKKAVVMTQDCGFVKLKARKNMAVGKEILFDERDTYHAFGNLRGMFAIVPVLAAACALVFVMTALFAGRSTGAYAYIDVDINPSVEFVVDKNEKIIEINALNSDAENVLKDISLKGTAFDKAVTEYIANAKSKGYMTAAQGKQVLVAYTLAKSNSKDEEKFYDYITSIENLSNSQDFVSTIIKVSSATKEQAAENGISMGRQAALENAKESGLDISLDNIKDISVNDVMQMIMTGNLKNTDTEIVKTTDKAVEKFTEKETASVKDTVAATEKATEGTKQEETTQAQAAGQNGQVAQSEAPAQSQPYEESSSPADNNTGSYGASNITGWATESGVYLSWDRIYDSRLDGYKVVISKSDSTPSYPDNGYMFWITNSATTSVTVDSEDKYNSGDIGGYLKAGQTYYFSITALYDGHTVRVPGNVITVKFPTTATEPATEPTSPPAPSTDVLSQTLTVSESMVSGAARISWNALSTDGLSYYKVVMSKSDSTPRYPENGYLNYGSFTSYDIKGGMKYNNTNDFGGTVKSGDTYYVSITAVYKTGYVYGSTVQVTIP